MATTRSYHHHFGHATGIHDPRRLIKEVEGLNAKAAVVIADVLGSMAFFWFTVVLALTSLPAVLTLVSPSLRASFPGWLIQASLISLVSWVAQTFIQLVALPVLQVSGNANGLAQDANTKHILEDADATRDHVLLILDRLDLATDGGLKDIYDAVLALQKETR